MDEFFNSSANVGIKSLSFATIDKNLSVVVNGCLSVELKSKIQSQNKNFIIVYKKTEYQCDEGIIKYFIKSTFDNRLELNLSLDTNNENDNENEKEDTSSNDKEQSASKENINDDNKDESTNNSDEKISSNEAIDNSSNISIKNESESDMSQGNLSDEDFFVNSVFLKFFNGEPVTINENNVNMLKFISSENNLNIPCFLKICTIFDKFYETYNKFDSIADLQYDIINIDDLIGIRNAQSEISQVPSADLLDPDSEQDEAITTISSFGSLFLSDSISPSFSQDFLEKITEVVDDIVDRIANEPDLANNIVLLYNILMKASIYRPENIQFYIKIIKQLDDPKPKGKGIKIIDIIRKLYLHNINQSTDFFVLHEMMLGGIFTVKEVLDVVKESTSLELKIWFAPYIEEIEAERKKQNNNNNDNDNEDPDDDSGYGNVIQDIEDRIYSISEPEKREFKVHFFNAIKENNWELHKILARQGANHTPIARAIRRDDVKKLQKILAFDPKTSVNDTIKWSAFDHIQYLMNSPTLIQYAAFYGAVKCFKFLMLNQAKMDKMDENKQFLINYAVAGGNTEIVRICIQQKVPTFSVLNSACLFYRFDLLDWILENVFPTISNNFKQSALQNALLNSLESFNFISISKLFQFIDVNSLYKSAAVDNELVLDIFNLFSFNREEKVYMLLCSTESHNFDFFKQIFSTLKIKLKDDTSKEINDDSTLEAFDGEIAEADIDENNNDENANNNNNNENQNANNDENANNDNNENRNANNDGNTNNNNNRDNAGNGIIEYITNAFHINANEFITEDGVVDYERIIHFLQEHEMEMDDDDDDNDDEPEFPLNIPLANHNDAPRNNDEGQNKNEDDEYFTMEDSDVLTLIIQAICNDSDKLMEFTNDNIYKIDLFKHIYISENVQYDVIQLSVIYGAIHCLKYITSRPDFKVSLCNKDDYSILRLAILFNQSEVLKFLLSFNGLNINSTEKEGGSAFTAATWDNQIPLVKILYKHGGVDINMKGKLGETPLTGTVLQKIPKMMELLLSYPEINVYEPNKDKKTAMMLCLENSEVDCFFTLIQCSKFDINSPKSCFDCSTAKFCLISKKVPSEMIRIVMDVPNVNLDEKFNGQTIGSQLKSKLLSMKDDDNQNEKDKDHKGD